jgi:2-phospho-L-lactate guanylyltransferase (CobY/MobA/RfbA family)
VVVPVGAGFRFSYGPGSFRRHLDEAARCGLALRVVRSDLSLDVDLPSDLPLTGCATPTRP